MSSTTRRWPEQWERQDISWDRWVEVDWFLPSCFYHFYLLRFFWHFWGIKKVPWRLGATGGTILGWSHERSTFAASQALPGAPGAPGGVHGWRGIGCGWKVDVTDHLAEIWLRCFHGIFAPNEDAKMHRDRFNEFHLKERYLSTLSCDIFCILPLPRQHLPGAIPGSMGRSLIESLIFWITPKDGSIKADGHWTWDWIR